MAIYLAFRFISTSGVCYEQVSKAAEKIGYPYLWSTKIRELSPFKCRMYWRSGSVNYTNVHVKDSLEIYFSTGRKVRPTT
jgi:hypothetical protein